MCQKEKFRVSRESVSLCARSDGPEQRMFTDKMDFKKNGMKTCKSIRFSHKRHQMSKIHLFLNLSHFSALSSWPSTLLVLMRSAPCHHGEDKTDQTTSSRGSGLARGLAVSQDFTSWNFSVLQYSTVCICLRVGVCVKKHKHTRTKCFVWIFSLPSIEILDCCLDASFPTVQAEKFVF